MSATMENLRSDVHKPPEQLEREANSARSAVEGTLAELEHTLSPGQMLDRVMDMVKRHGGEFGDNLLTQVRNNPLPTIVAGVGMAWLMSVSKRPPPRGPSRSMRGDGKGDGSSEWSTSAFDTARSAASSAAQSASDAAQSVGDTVRAAGDKVRGAADAASSAARRAAATTRDSLGAVADASQAGARGVSEGYAYLFREQPLVLGAMAIAMGAALGAMLPSTPTEDQLIGETSDEAKARLKAEAQSRTGTLRDAAADLVDKAKEKMDGMNGRESESASARPSGSDSRASSQDGRGGAEPGSPVQGSGSIEGSVI